MKADGLDEVLVADGGQQSTVHHAEVKEQGLIQVGFPACGGRAAGIVLPGGTLDVEGEEAGQWVRGWGSGSSAQDVRRRDILSASVGCLSTRPEEQEAPDH